MTDESGDGDILEQGGRASRLPGWPSGRLPAWRPSRGAGILALAALAVGLAAGYAAGDWHGRDVAAPRQAVPAQTVPDQTGAAASPSASVAPAGTFPFAGSLALTQETGACSAQAAGQRLALGVQVTNRSTAPLTLQTVTAVLPLGGLTQTGWHWATCGAVPESPGQADAVLLPGQTTWLTVTFRVAMHCPAAAPVQFRVGYQVQGKPATASLPGFPDLGQVPYSGCQVVKNP